MLIVSILMGLIGGAAGFFTGLDMGFEEGMESGLDIGFEEGMESGLDIGFEKGLESANVIQVTKSLDEIRNELRVREQEVISSLIDAKVDLLKIDEGGLFKTEYVQYIDGYLTNNASLAIAKDVALNVDYYSKTGTKIKNQKITIYEFIKPGGTFEFKKRIDDSEEVYEIKFQIIDVKSE